MDNLPEELKEQIDAPIGKENLKVLRRVKKPEIKDGDIFVCSINGEVFYYGKVLQANIVFKKNVEWRDENSHLIFIFRTKTAKKDLSNFFPNYNQLLVGPKIITDGYWRLGYFETIGNIPLTAEEKSLDYGFFNSDVIGPGGVFVKADGEEINNFPKYFSIYGTAVYAGIYMSIRTETILDPTLLTI